MFDRVAGRASASTFGAIRVAACLLVTLTALLASAAAAGAARNTHRTGGTSSNCPSSSYPAPPPSGELSNVNGGTYDGYTGSGSVPRGVVELDAFLGKPNPFGGSSVTWQVVCGPDQGQQGTAHVGSAQTILGGVVGAIPVQNVGGLGEDEILVTYPNGEDTAMLDWVAPPRSCSPSLKWLAALKCAIHNNPIYKLKQTVLNTVGCVSEIASSWFPIGDMAKLLEAGDTAAAVAKAGRGLKDQSKIVDLIDALKALRSDGLSAKRLDDAFKDVKSVKGFVEEIWSLAKDIDNHGAVVKVVEDVANIAGFGDCVNLLEQIFSGHTRPSGAVLSTFVGTPGAGAPPATLGQYTMQALPVDSTAEGTTETSLEGPTGTLSFGVPLIHDLVGSDWETWSNDYSGDVYSDFATASDGNYEITVSLPAHTGAFYIYAEPDDFEDFDMSATANDGTTSGATSVYGDAGAQYFGFYTKCGHTIQSITVTDPGADSGVAIGEFGIAPSC